LQSCNVLEFYVQGPVDQTSYCQQTVPDPMALQPITYREQWFQLIDQLDTRGGGRQLDSAMWIVVLYSQCHIDCQVHRRSKTMDKDLGVSVVLRVQ
jgi:hypothetical protein